MDEFASMGAQEVDAEVIDDELMISSASFEVDMSGIQRDVEDLTEAIDQALTVYGDALVEEDAIATMGRGEAREYELRLSRAIRAADELRRQLNRDYKVPLDMAKRRYDELMGPVIELHEAYKQRRVEFEEADKARKLGDIRTAYERLAPRIALPAVEGDEAPIPFERVFEMRGTKWLNKSVSLNAIEQEMVEFAATVNEGERRLDEAGPKHATEARAVFWQTLDVGKALAHDKELCALEARHAALAARNAQAIGGDSAAQAGNAVAAAQTADAPLSPANGQPADAPLQAFSDTPSPSAAERKPRVMLIEGATDDECRQIAALCKSLGIRGVFKGPQFYETVKTWMTR